VKETIIELEHKKETLQYMNNQWEKMPKDINRNQYLKRINEIIAKLKNQKQEIRGILDDIVTIQKDTDQLVGKISKIDTEVEDYIFNEAKKDKVAKEIYKEIVQLKEDFDKLTTNVQEQNKLRALVRENDTKSEDFRIKYRNGQEISKLITDLNGIKAENQQLEQEMKAKGIH